MFTVLLHLKMLMVSILSEETFIPISEEMLMVSCWQKTDLDDCILILLKMLMLQTDIIIRKVITEITEMAIFSQQFLEERLETEDDKKGSLRMYAQDNTAGKS